MSKWNKVTLYKFQSINIINRRDISDLDKSLYAVCVIFDMTEHQLDHCNVKVATILCNKVAKIFSSPFDSKAPGKIGKYQMNYDLSTMRFGQYMELSFYLSKDPLANAQKILASISNLPGKGNESSDHGIKCDYFLQQRAEPAIGAFNLILEKFQSFNKNYNWLFGLDDSHGEKVTSHKFNQRYGWVYAAETVRQYEGISLDEVHNLPTIQVFNDLAYLKAKDKYMVEVTNAK